MAMADGGESLYERFDRRSVVSSRFKEIYTIRPTPSFCSRMKSPGVSAAREFALSRLVHFTKSLSTHPPYFEIAKEEGSNLGFAALPGIIVALTLRRSFSSVAILDNARFSRLKREAKGRVFKVLARGVVDDDKISKDKSNGTFSSIDLTDTFLWSSERSIHLTPWLGQNFFQLLPGNVWQWLEEIDANQTAVLFKENPSTKVRSIVGWRI